MKPRDLTILGLTMVMTLLAFGCIRLAVGIILDEITIAQLQRDVQARGPANYDNHTGTTTEGWLW